MHDLMELSYKIWVQLSMDNSERISRDSQETIKNMIETYVRENGLPQLDGFEWNYNEMFEYYHLDKYVIKENHMAEKPYKLFENDRYLCSFLDLDLAKMAGGCMYRDSLLVKEA